MVTMDMRNLPVVWQPRKDDLAHSVLTQALRHAGYSDYDSYLAWSLREPEAFWAHMLRFLEIHWDTFPESMLDLSSGKPWARWFVGGRLNITTTLLERHLQDRASEPALIWEHEDGTVQTLSYAQLTASVLHLSARLREEGLKRGDRVGLLFPMAPETVVAFLAVIRLGAITVPLFSGFGPEAVRIRLEQSQARFVLLLDHTIRRGKTVHLLSVARQAVEGLDPRPTLLVFRRDRVTLRKDEVDLGMFSPSDAPAVGGEPTVVDADHPLMLIYTSGTTGRPKGTVHVHGGFPIKAAQDMAHLFDVRPGDRMFWLTDLGWMMGPWLIFGTLIRGATMVLYEGAPDHPEPSRLWTLLHRHRVQIAGIAPTLIRALMDNPAARPPQPLSHLRILGSTGEPWNEDPWWWTFRELGREEVPIINYSGGTEISGGILGCVVHRPLKPMSFNTVVPGVDADVVNEHGESLRNEVGRLVIRFPNPGMTRGFWKDPDRYLATYWSTFPDLWDHGDLVLRDEEGFFYILGRADDTLKVAGKRLGPAEMESVAVSHPQVREAAVVGLPHPVKGQVPILFVVPVDPGQLDPDAVRDFVAERMGKALQPHRVIALPDLPRTRNGKVMRRLLRRLLLGEDPGDVSALVNPEILQTFKNLRLDVHR